MLWNQSENLVRQDRYAKAGNRSHFNTRNTQVLQDAHKNHNDRLLWKCFKGREGARTWIPRLRRGVRKDVPVPDAMNTNFKSDNKLNNGLEFKVEEDDVTEKA